jgi:hypothetical protein
MEAIAENRVSGNDATTWASAAVWTVFSCRQEEPFRLDRTLLEIVQQPEIMLD